jgi:hypothetical protein
MTVTGSAKFKTLVGDFVATAADLDCTVSASAVAADLEQRIAAIATQFGVSQQTVLRSYIDDDWGRELARSICTDLVRRETRMAAAPDHELSAAVAIRLAASLGVAVHCFALNEELVHGGGDFNVREAGEAVFGLCSAVSGQAPGGEMVSVPGRILMLTRGCLEICAERLQQRRWTAMGGGVESDGGLTEMRLLGGVSRDLQTLRHYLPSPTGAS